MYDLLQMYKNLHNCYYMLYMYVLCNLLLYMLVLLLLLCSCDLLLQLLLIRNVRNFHNHGVLFQVFHIPVLLSVSNHHMYDLLQMYKNLHNCHYMLYMYVLCNLLLYMLVLLLLLCSCDLLLQLLSIRNDRNFHNHGVLFQLFHILVLLSVSNHHMYDLLQMYKNLHNCYYMLYMYVLCNLLLYMLVLLLLLCSCDLLLQLLLIRNVRNFHNHGVLFQVFHIPVLLSVSNHHMYDLLQMYKNLHNCHRILYRYKLCNLLLYMLDLSPLIHNYDQVLLLRLPHNYHHSFYMYRLYIHLLYMLVVLLLCHSRVLLQLMFHQSLLILCSLDYFLLLL